MQDYYSQRLSADRLMRVYEVASPRVRRYLESEIDESSLFCIFPQNGIITFILLPKLPSFPRLR